MTETIIGKLREVRPGSKRPDIHLSDDELLSAIAKQYKGPRKERMLEMFLQILPNTPPHEIKKWADSQFLRKILYRDFGRMLRFERLCNGITLEEAGERINAHAVNICFWEAGWHQFIAHKLPAVCMAYNMRRGEAEMLLSARLPALDDEWLAKWPQERRSEMLVLAYCQRKGQSRELFSENPLLAGRDLSASDHITPEEYERLFYLALPALDESWLRRQPEHLRSGLLLAAFRIREGLSQAEMGKLIGLSRQTCSNLERGVSMEGGIKRIGFETRKKIARALDLSEGDVRKLHTACIPAFSRHWLREQAVEGRPGLLLAAYRERAGFFPGEFALAMGVTAKALLECETGRCHILHALIYKVSAALSLSSEEKAAWVGAIIDRRIAEEITISDREIEKRAGTQNNPTGQDLPLEDRIAMRREELKRLNSGLPRSKFQLLVLERVLRSLAGEDEERGGEAL